MKSAIALLVTAALAASPAFAACSKSQIQSWMASCDRLPTNQQKCDSRACHRAIHWLVEPETRDCYVNLGLGPVSDLDKYIALDEFCHAEDVRALELEFVQLVNNTSE
ncbi:Aste57867_8450 [Aphanomyces stellatus]|uniref:Aste57867_8450 protein n=1 Tax=Aphanomyces stellatus TaxID=120398 RepID=A0A485KKB7_9STRA|nr:hypothetical protein As57867_008418 [Aphanomyces stellatus]VFT85336.1 Aste57867_8450 [Aphanomyces stellatus]